MTLTRNPWWIAAGLIMLGGLLMAAAAAVRWLPCLGGSDQVCLARQALALDYVVPARPGEPLVVSAVLAALPRDIAVVLIEHDMDMALAFAERITLLNFGAVVLEGTRAEVIADPRTREVYLGE